MIFFDLGWTLEDETPAQRRRAEQTVTWAAGRGVATTVERLLELQAHAGRDGAPSVYPEALARLGLSPEDHLEARRAFPWKAELCVPVARVHELLSVLPARLGLLANQSRPISTRLGRYSILPLFEVVLCSCEVGLAKPDEAIFRLAEREAARCGDPGPHWMVGDRVDNDIVPAKRLGWKTIRIVTGDYRWYQSKGPAETPDHAVEDLAGAVEILVRELSRGTGGDPGYGHR